MKKKVVLLIISLILLIFVAFGYGKKQNSPQSGFTPGETEGMTGTTSDEFQKITVTLYDDVDKMGITWYTKSGEEYRDDVQVFYKDTGKKADIFVTAQSGICMNDNTWIWHQAVVNGLDAGTEYLYRVGDEEKKLWSEPGSFQTGNRNTTDFSFLALSDTQGDANFAAQTLKMAVEAEPGAAFIVHSGDFVDDGAEEKQWTDMIETSAEIFRKYPLLPSVGNHVSAPGAFWQHFEMKIVNHQDITSGVYTSCDYGKVHLISLNTNTFSADGTSYIDEEQLNWLDQDLAEARQNGCEWIVVNMHIGPYTAGMHADDIKTCGEQGMCVRLRNVLEKYNVDLVLEGHDHLPCVTYPLVQGMAAEQGVVYMDTGSAGTKTYTTNLNMPPEYFCLFQYVDEKPREHNTYQNFAVIRVTGQKMHVTMYEANAVLQEKIPSVLYEFEITH